jgi:hypothetical protein
VSLAELREAMIEIT